MPSTPTPVPQSVSAGRGAEATIITNLRVTGELPAPLTGQYMGIGPHRIDAQTPLADFRSGRGMVHAVTLDAGRATSYRNRRVRTDTVAHQRDVEPISGPPPVDNEVDSTNLIAFGTSILGFSDGALAYELDTTRDTARPVDLAGARRSLAAKPTVDPHTDELHLLTFASLPSQLHVAVSRGGLTRRVRSIDEAPSRIRELELTCDDVVLMAQGFVGVAPRAGADIKPMWFAIDTDARHIAGAHAHAETVVIYTTGPSLVRWTLDRQASTLHSDVLDAAPHTFATSNRRQPGSSQRFLWTVGSRAAHKHDLFSGERRLHDFGEGQTPGELCFIADPDRGDREDGGWLVGFVHDNVDAQAEFVVLDAEAIERPAMAKVHIPRRVPSGTRGTWIPANRP